MDKGISKTYFFKCDPNSTGKYDHTIGVEVCLRRNKNNKDVFSCNATLKTSLALNNHNHIITDLVKLTKISLSFFLTA